MMDHSRTFGDLFIYWVIGGGSIAALFWWRASKRGWRGWFWALFGLLQPWLAFLFYWFFAIRQNRREREKMLTSQRAVASGIGVSGWPVAPNFPSKQG
jgi:hypothetical protein